MKKLVIERSRWLRGDRAGDKGGVQESMLYAPHSRTMCCLGFLARSCGAKVDDIYHKPTPDNTSGFEWPKGILTDLGDDTLLTTSLISVNDDSHLTDAQREKKLKALFKEIDIDVVFK